MAYSVGPLSRKTSAPWDRLKPVKLDPLESMGFVSKGDTRLLDLKNQESFYHKIVNRYMLFCTRYSKNLDEAFASISFNDEVSASSDAARNPPSILVPPSIVRPFTSSPPIGDSVPSLIDAGRAVSPHESSSELTIILFALRKLREALLATSSNTTSLHFSQRVHVFNIRLALLALHPPSYHPPLLHLLFTLQRTEHPLPTSELTEMITYLILDLACRQNDLSGAFALRLQSNKILGYENKSVNSILAAIATNDWISFWRVRRKVDGYVRAILHWKTAEMRKTALKTIGRSYMGCDIKWILRCTTGDEMTWDELVQREDVGWIRDGEKAVIRKPKTQAPAVAI